MADSIRNNYIEYLPKLLYPIRVGEHTNTAFGLNFAFDYAVTMKDTLFKNLITKKSIEFYAEDRHCPITWEPSGYDFLSPCLEEASLMSKVLEPDTFQEWITAFLSDLDSLSGILEPAKVLDRTDGKLVHLDGLNFSRAWNLYQIAAKSNQQSILHEIGMQHFRASYSNIVDGNYEGQHWLGTFALYALKMQQTNAL
jgi:hypothetical protein